MAQNKMGTTVGGHLVWHSGNVEQLFSVVGSLNLSPTMNFDKITVKQNSNIGGTTPANGAIVVGGKMGIDDNEIYCSSDLILGTTASNVIIKKSTDTLFTFGASLHTSAKPIKVPTALIGTASASPSITLAIGDSDTGFKWISDGKLQSYANNVAIDEVTPTGRKLLKPIDANSQAITSVSSLSSANISVSDTVTAKRVEVGYTHNQDNSVGCSNWFRSSGDTGWFNATHGGGIYMADPTWVRTYGSKKFHVANTNTDAVYTTGGVKADGGFYHGTQKLDDRYLGKTAKAADAEKIDGYDLSQLMRRIDNTTDYKATSNIMCIQQREDSLPFGLTGAYPYGSLITLNDSASRLRLWAPHQESGKSSLYIATGWNTDVDQPWERLLTFTDGDARYLTTSSKAADSNKLDGLDSSNFTRYQRAASMNFDTLTTSGLYDNSGSTPVGKPPGAHNGVSALHMQNHTGNYFNQLVFSAVDGSIWSRHKNNTTSWTAYNRVLDKAYADGIYLGKTDKATDSEKVDGINGSSLLRSDTDDTFTGNLISGDRSKGIIGVYDSKKTDQIWSMGAAYKNNSTGADFGNLYGLAYKHTNNTTGGTMAGGHQMVWCTNGIPQAAMGDSGVWTSGELQSGSHLRAGGNGYFSGTSIYGDGKEMLKFSDGWLRINEASNFSSGIFCGSSILRTDGQLEVGSGGSKFKATAAGDVVSSSLTTRGNIACAGDLKMTGTDSYIWTPTTDAGFTGIWDSKNSRAVIKYQNNVGTIDLHSLTKHFGGMTIAQAGGESNLRVWDGGATQGKVLEMSSPDKSSYAYYYQSGGSDGRLFAVNGAITATGNVTAFSDAKLKENVKPIKNALEKVTQIRGVTYDRIDTGAHEAGVIAQEVEAVLPEVVTEHDGTKAVAYGNLNALLIEALKEEKSKREALEERLAKLEALLLK